MQIDVEVPPGWGFNIYHRKEGGFSVSLCHKSYAQKVYLIKGEGLTLDAAMAAMKKELVRLAKEVPDAS